MKTKFLIIFLTLISFSSAIAQNPGDTIFNSAHIHDINITLSQTNWWDSLMFYKMHSDSFNLSTQPMLGNVTFDGTLIDSVGVQLKGNSTFGYPGQKKPIKLTFNNYVQGEKLEGLTAIDLNNNALDPTMMREKLLLDFMNKKGLPAPRCTYAKVSYNGQYVGLYKIIEQVDKEFIQTHFNDWGGNLFKGDPYGTLNWLGNNTAAYYPNYELHSNTQVNDWSDLVNMIDNINNTPTPDFYDTLETNLNTLPMIRQWAARNLFVDLDSYFHAPHNYYLYHKTITNKFEWCTWDVSVCFGFYPYWTEDSTEHVSILSSNAVLTSKMLANPIYKTTYLNTICDYLDYLDTTVMSPIIDSIANRIYPAFVAEPDSNQMFPDQIFYYTLDTMTITTPIGDIPALKKFIVNRRNIVINQLASLHFTCTNSVNDLSRPDLSAIVYPNPFNSYTTIKLSAPIKNAELIMYNVFGQEVKTIKNISGQEIKLQRDNLPNGIYFIRLTENNKTIATSKLIITD